MADSQHKYLLERGWSQQQIDEVIRKAHEWLRGAGYTPLTEQGHWNGIMGSTQSYHLPSREKNARGMTEAFVEMLKGGKILDASRVHKFSRPGAKEMMAREVVARKGSKRVELSGPQADGRWVVTVMQEEKQVVPGEANDRFVESKWYSTEATARRAASKILASRPGAKATFKVEDRFYFGKGRKERFGRVDSMLSDASAYIAGGDDEASAILSDLVKERKRGGLSAEQAKELNKLIQQARAMGVFSRPGQPERFGASDKVDGLIATAYRALRNGDKAAARRLIASAEALVQSDSSVPNYIVNELKDLKKSLSF
jgi:hypothetical protein